MRQHWSHDGLVDLADLILISCRSQVAEQEEAKAQDIQGRPVQVVQPSDAKTQAATDGGAQTQERGGRGEGEFARR